MSITNEINDFYYHMSLFELQAFHEGELFKGLSYNSILYLNVIDLTTDCTISKLAKLLNITKSAVTLKINELEKQGVITKTQSSKDKRVYYLTISPDMKHTFSLYDKAIAQIEETLKKKYSKEELQTFEKIMHTISDYDWENFKNE